MKKSSSLQTLFFRGDYQDVLKLTLNSSIKIPELDFPFFIGSLAFNARREEADGFYRSRSATLSLSSRVACRFFLGIAHCRHGDLEKGRNLLKDNLMSSWRSKDPVTRFYVMQGLGFYRYINCRFRPALKLSERAWVAAAEAGFDYGRALAGDLLGHALIQTGSLHAGLARLEESSEVAVRTGDGGLFKSIHISIQVYRAQFGFNAENALTELEDARNKLDTQNAHAIASLLLETANQLVLKGRLREASRALEETSTLIYRAQHRRYGHLLTLRWAELSYRKGEYAAALHSVRSTRSQLDREKDLPLILMALGLELKTLKQIDPADPAHELEEELLTLTKKSARMLSIGMLDRLPMREDLLGNAFREYLGKKNTSPQQVAKIIGSGYLGRLYEALNLKHSAQAFIAGPNGKDCIVLDAGEVHYRAKGLTPQIFDLFGELKKGERSKSDLVAALWRYEYHPLRHDPLIYSAIARARELLGENSYWIEATEAGYRLRAAVEVIDLHAQSSNRESYPPPVGLELSKENPETLHYRHLALLKKLETQACVGVNAELAEEFKVSEMTLRRDFKVLLSEGYVRRSGQARATRYRLIEGTEHVTSSSHEI
ncbi:MAG: DeoR family transcriptional regulator [Bdellovibrionales bacterium]|nr:DeoR family transcriptional regulator [Oligoflexia bacterium]